MKLRVALERNRRTTQTVTVLLHVPHSANSPTKFPLIRFARSGPQMLLRFGWTTNSSRTNRNSFSCWLHLWHMVSAQRSTLLLRFHDKFLRSNGCYILNVQCTRRGFLSVQRDSMMHMSKQANYAEKDWALWRRNPLREACFVRLRPVEQKLTYDLLRTQLQCAKESWNECWRVPNVTNRGVKIFQIVLRCYLWQEIVKGPQSTNICKLMGLTTI